MSEVKKVDDVTEVKEYKTVDDLANEINTIKEQTKKFVLNSSMEIGKRLIMAKSQIDHGRWSEWLETNVNYSQRTATNLMKLYEEFRDVDLINAKTNSQALANLSYTKAIAILGLPKEDREAFVQENNIEEMSTRELTKAIKERDEAVQRQEALQTSLSDLNDELKESESEKDKLKKEKDSLQTKIENKDKSITKLKEQVEKLGKENIEKDYKLKMSKLKDEIKQITEEKENLVKDKKSLEIKINAVSNQSVMKYGILFEDLVKKCNDIIKTLGDMKSEDAASYEKYKKATLNLFEKLSVSIS